MDMAASTRESTMMDAERDAPARAEAGAQTGKRDGWLRRLVMAPRRRVTDERSDGLVRRRADSHPDAPPRPPLMASRDLPPLSVVRTLSHHSSEAVAVNTLAQADEEPKLPADEGREGLTLRSVADPVAPLNARPSALRATTPDSISLVTLLDRFEHGLSRHVAVAQARSAETQLSERLIFVEQDPAVRTALRALRPVQAASSAPHTRTQTHTINPPASALDEAIEAELDIALGTLRRLTEQARY